MREVLSPPSCFTDEEAVVDLSWVVASALYFERRVAQWTSEQRGTRTEAGSALSTQRQRASEPPLLGGLCSLVLRSSFVTPGEMGWSRVV